LGRLYDTRHQTLSVDGVLCSLDIPLVESVRTRLADPYHHGETITSRPLLLHAIGRQTHPAGRTTVIITAHMWGTLLGSSGATY
jgi:hypothetical protein